MTDEKQCTGDCRETKPFTEFHKSSKSKDGLRYQCKSCAKKYHATWRKASQRRAANKRRLKAVNLLTYASY